jgi:hydrogenase nickel incorporation protein HypA/HybF
MPRLAAAHEPSYIRDRDMHELSIATSLFEQVQRHTPPATRVSSLRVRIGPMQGIEPDSLRFGWEVVWKQGQADGSAPVPELALELLPWRLTCPQCSRKWESAELYVACECGCATPAVEGGSELQLVSIEVQDK